MSSAVVPVLSAYRVTKSSTEFWALAQALGARVAVAVGVLSVAGVALAPAFVALIAPGFLADPEKFGLTVWLTRVVFPFIFLVGLWAFFCGLLNSLHHFAMPALGPAVLNVVIIGSCLWLVPAIAAGRVPGLAPRTHPPVLGLVWGVLLGGAAQLAIQIPTARSLGFRWQWRWRHPGANQAMGLLAPRLLGAAVHQVDVLVNTILASLSSLAGEGAVAALYFANRLVQLPLALFATAWTQASLPALSEHAAMKELDQFRSTVLALLRIVIFESLPAAIGLLALSGPIVQLCFERGAFDRYSTVMTAQTLSLFAIGLIAYAASKVLTGAFYALHDTRTPVRLAVEALGVNVVLALLFVRPLQVSGLALATSLSSLFNAWRLVRKLERRLGMRLLADLAAPAGRISLASLLMGIGCWAAWAAVGGRLPLAAGLPLIIVGGIMLYGVSCTVLRVPELATTLQWFITPRTTRSSSSG